MSEEVSIFTKIIQGEIPCYKLYEDERTFAFMDIHPIQPGQALVIPKKQVMYTWDLDDEDYQAVMMTARKVARAIKAAFPDKELVAMHIEGLQVAHAHLKIFPFNTDAEFRNKPDPNGEPDHAALAAIADRIVQHL